MTELDIFDRRLADLPSPEHPGQDVQDRREHEQAAVARDQREVLEHAADHRPEQVRPERRGRVGRVPEPLGEHQVRDEDGEEGERGGGQEARRRRERE